MHIRNMKHDIIIFKSKNILIFIIKLKTNSKLHISRCILWLFSFKKAKDHKLVYFNMFAPSHISQDGQMVV